MAQEVSIAGPVDGGGNVRVGLADPTVKITFDPPLHVVLDKVALIDLTLTSQTPVPVKESPQPWKVTYAIVDLIKCDSHDPGDVSTLTQQLNAVPDGFELVAILPLTAIGRAGSTSAVCFYKQPG
jgi:hypothetical protein